MIYTNEMIKSKKEKEKKRQDIINNVITFILIVLIIVCAYFFYQKFIQKENPINLFGYKSFVILTGSMEPNLMPGDMIFAKSSTKENLKVGDIITFWQNDTSTSTTHRIVDIIEKDGKTYYQTKGDNNSSNDSDLVPYEKIVGTMIFRVSKMGKMLMGISSTGGIALILIVILLKWSMNAKKQDKIAIRENCRKRFNFPKYIRKKFESRSS